MKRENKIKSTVNDLDTGIIYTKSGWKVYMRDRRLFIGQNRCSQNTKYNRGIEN